MHDDNAFKSILVWNDKRDFPTAYLHLPQADIDTLLSKGAIYASGGNPKEREAEYFNTPHMSLFAIAAVVTTAPKVRG
jgi:hypothetical protein